MTPLHGTEMILEGLIDAPDYLRELPETATPVRQIIDGNWALNINNISKSYLVRGKRMEALRNFSLKIEPGELVSLVGPSGCGKSTLLKIIAGLEQPDSGWVESKRERETRGGSDRLMIFQEAALFPWLTVFDNVAYGLKLRKVPKEKYQTLVEDYLALVGLEDFKEACIHQLSGGMKQRVALARAMVLDPEILLMDEAFAALDVKTKGDMYQLLLKVWQETGKTILFITHNVDEALILSGRVLVMATHPGYIKQEYRLEVEHPRNLADLALQKIRSEILLQFENKSLAEVGGGVLNGKMEE